MSLEGALEKDELNISACYLLRRVLALASASSSLCLLFPSHAPILRGHQKGKTTFHLSSCLPTSVSGYSSLPEEAAVRDLGIQQQSAS